MSGLRIRPRLPGLAGLRLQPAEPSITGLERVTPRWVPVLLLVLAAGAVAAAVVAIGPAASPAARVRLVTAERGVIQSTVSGTGTLEAANNTDVNFRTSGQVTHVFVSAGDHVRNGELLAELNPTNAQLGVDAAEANLSSAQAKLDQAESPPATTASKPGQSSAGSSSSRSATTAGDVASAQAAVESAQISVDDARQTLADTRLHAPAAGTVTSVNGQVGDTVGSGGNVSGASSAGSSSSSGSGSGSGSAGSGNGGAGGGGTSSGSGSSSSGTGSSSNSSAFIAITDLGRLTLTVPFSESDIHQVRVGQPATVTVNALPGEKLAAHVTSVADLSTTSNGVVSYDVDLHLDQSVPGLKPGMTASAQVIVKQVGNAVSVPTAAISRRAGAATVTVMKGGKRVTRTVVTGVTGDTTTQVVSGLSPGEQVAIAIPTGGSSTTGQGQAGGARAGGGFGGAIFGGGGGGFRGGGGGGGFRGGPAGGD